LVAGCRGQIGTALTQALVQELGEKNVIACDLVESDPAINCQYEQLDVTDGAKYRSLVEQNDVSYVLHLAAILSSLGEKNPKLAYDVNVVGAQNAFEIASDLSCQLFMPSSIAVFGGDKFPKKQTPDDVILQPKTIYGVTKVFNELLGDYYRSKFGLDFRSLRYPGVISSQKYAFNGTTDYSTEIFFHALEQQKYSCWLGKEQALPMIYIDDCIDATIKFLKTPASQLNRSTYNLAGISFTPEMLVEQVQRLIPGVQVSYDPCPTRSKIAAQWPMSIDDSAALADWGWKYDTTMYQLAKKILSNIDAEYKEGRTLVFEEEEHTSSDELEPAFEAIASQRTKNSPSKATPLDGLNINMV